MNPQDLEDIVIPLVVPHRHLTVVWGYEARTVLTKGASILGLLAPCMEIRIGRKGVERGIQGKLECSGGRPWTAFTHRTWDASSHNLTISLWRGSWHRSWCFLSPSSSVMIVLTALVTTCWLWDWTAGRRSCTSWAGQYLLLCPLLFPSRWSLATLLTPGSLDCWQY